MLISINGGMLLDSYNTSTTISSAILAPSGQLLHYGRLAARSFTLSPPVSGVNAENLFLTWKSKVFETSNQLLCIFMHFPGTFAAFAYMTGLNAGTLPNNMARFVGRFHWFDSEAPIASISKRFYTDWVTRFDAQCHATLLATNFHET